MVSLAINRKSFNEKIAKEFGIQRLYRFSIFIYWKRKFQIIHKIYLKRAVLRTKFFLTFQKILVKIQEIFFQQIYFSNFLPCQKMNSLCSNRIVVNWQLEICTGISCQFVLRNKYVQTRKMGQDLSNTKTERNLNLDL